MLQVHQGVQQQLLALPGPHGVRARRCCFAEGIDMVDDEDQGRFLEGACNVTVKLGGS